MSTALLDNVRDQISSQASDDFARYVALISKTEPDAGDAAELRRIIGTLDMSLTTVTEHAQRIARVTELAPIVESAMTRREAHSAAFENYIAKKKHEKEELERLAAAVRESHKLMNNAKQAMEQADKAASESDRLRRETPYLFDAESPTPFTTFGRRQIEGRIDWLKRQSEVMDMGDARRVPIVDEMERLKDLLRQRPAV